MSAIYDLWNWYKTRGVYEAYDSLVERLVPTDDKTFDPFPENELAAVVFDQTGLPPADFLKLDIPARLPWIRRALENDPKAVWSVADTPNRWAKKFGVSSRTFKRRVKEGRIRANKLSDRLYQVDTRDVPKND